MSSVYIRLAVSAAWAAAVRADPGRAATPLLDRLLARADLSPEEAPWRARGMQLLGLAALAPTAAVVQALCLGEVAVPWVMLATPVHMVASHSGVQLPPDGVLDINFEEAQRLVNDFNRVFADSEARLAALDGGGMGARLLCLSMQPIEAATVDPREAQGSDVWGFQPSGAASGRLRRLMSEIELWLFEHEINVERAARRVVPITGLWLWAGGATLPGARIAPAVAGLTGFTAGDDPILSAIHPCTEFPRTPSSGVIVIHAPPGSAAWADAQRRWLEPALGALRAGAVDQLQLSLGRQCFSVRASSWRRFWRRPRPWWEVVAYE